MNIYTPITLIEVGRRAEESEQLLYNWESLDINSLVFPQDKVVCFFGGNSTTRPEQANGNAKVPDSMISAKNRKKTQIFSFSYKTEPYITDTVFNKMYQSEAELLFEKSFKPLIFDSKGNMKEIQGIEKAFKRLIFNSHCGGSRFVNIIIDKFYDTLIQKFPPATAEMLINKIQYFSYAPLENPTHNVNAVIVSPLVDINNSWNKALDLAVNSKIDIDYPKGIIKRYIKARSSGKIAEFFKEVFQETRAIMFKIGNSTYIIPGQMNPNMNFGDHSIDCLSKQNILESDTDCAETAKSTRYAVQLFLNAFTSDAPFDQKGTFTKAARNFDENPPASQKAF